MDVAILVAHEIKVADRHCNGLCANAEKTADIDDGCRVGADTVHMVNFTDLVIIRALNGGAFQNGWREFGFSQTDVIAVVHCSSSCLGFAQNKLPHRKTVPSKIPHAGERGIAAYFSSVHCWGLLLGAFEKVAEWSHLFFGRQVFAK